MKRSLVLALVFVTTAFLAAQPTHAGKVYFGGSYGQTTADGLTVDDIDDGSVLTNVHIDDSDSAWKLFAGYRFLKFVAIEAAATDWGEFSLSADSDGSGADYAAGPVDVLAGLDGYTISGLGILPLGRKFDVWVRAGYYIWDLDVSIANSAFGTISDPDDGQDLLLGAGFAWKWGFGGLRLEYETVDIDDESVDMVSAGLHFRF